MDFLEIAKVYAIATITFFAIDILWLGFVAKKYYQRELKNFLGPVNWPVAIVFYLIFIAGITFFALIPAIETSSLSKALTFGALFGFFAYSTYDLTNLSTLKHWPAKLTVIDIVWGTILSASVATITFLITTKLL